MRFANDEERERMIEKTREAARREIAKSQILQFRCEEKMILQLFALAAKRNMQMSAMVRGWVKERLAEEQAAENGESNPLVALAEAEAQLNRLRAHLTAKPSKSTAVARKAKTNRTAAKAKPSRAKPTKKVRR